MAKLTELEQRVLRFAIAKRPLHEARDEFGWRPAGYVQKLNQLLDDPRAEQAEPMDVRRLRGIRDERSRARASRTFRRSA